MVCKILFIFRYRSTFVEQDLKILRKYYEVIPLQATNNLFRTLIKLLIYSPKVDLLFVWFAGHHALLSVLFAKIFSKKSAIVVGGYEVAKDPEMNYGAFNTLKRRLPAKFALKYADIVLPVSNFTKQELLRRVSPRRVELIYNGIDIKKFNKSGKNKCKLVLTVASGLRSVIKLKGIDTFIAAAADIPEANFTILGLSDGDRNILKNVKLPKNIVLFGWVSQDELIYWYQKAKIYCQLSYRESFGMALAEAMSCECIPVVTANSALPEVVGSTGFYVSYDDSKATAKAIKEAFKLSEVAGKDARERINEMFSTKRRERKLIEIIGEFISSSQK